MGFDDLQVGLRRFRPGNIIRGTGMSLFVEDLFNYTAAQNMNGQNGGTGWPSAWVSNSEGSPIAIVESGSQTYTGLVTGSNNKAIFYAKANDHGGGTGNLGERAFNAILNNTTNVYWIAFTFATWTAKYAVTWQLNGLTTDSGGANNATVLALSASTTATNVSANGTSLWTGSSSYVIHLIMVKLTMSGAAATPVRVDWYLDPDLSTDPAGWTPTTTQTGWYVKTQIDMWKYPTTGTATSSSDSKMLIDNFRIASTSQEATGNPLTNPGNFLMMFYP